VPRRCGTPLGTRHPARRGRWHLPDPQRDALGRAFYLRDGNPPDRFAAGLGTLSLLSEAAADGPLLCLVDDAQWLDTNSAQALAFVARHLTGAPVGVVLALRQPGGEHELTGLPELPVRGLADGDAQALLDSVLIGPVDQRVRNRIAADAHGNPAALLQLPRMLTPESWQAASRCPPQHRYRAGSRKATGGGSHRYHLRRGGCCSLPRPS